MIFAILFVVAFLIGLLIYRAKHNWLYSVLVPMALFLANTLFSESSQETWTFTLLLGLPMVFLGGLLGAYVVQIRLDVAAPDEDETETEMDQ